MPSDLPERPDDLFSVAGKRVLITGGTAGIGLGVACHFIAAGAHVVISGRRTAGPRIAESIGARFVRMDVADDESVEQATGQAARLLGGLDVLILNAGIAKPVGPIEALDLDEFRDVVNVNVGGVVRGLRYGVSLLSPGGVVLVTSSPGGRQALAAPGMIGYSASKAAVDMIVASAGLELAAKGIRVSGVLPGFIRTQIAAGSGHDDSWLARLTASGQAREPADMGPVYQFLASDAGAMLQSSVVAADDGCSAGLSASALRYLTGGDRVT